MAASRCPSALATHGAETKTITMQSAPNREDRPAVLDRINSGWPRLLVLFIGASVCSAQGDRGGIIGRVIDPTQAVVPTAAVTAKNLETGYTRETKTGDEAAVANTETHEVPPWVGAAVVVGGLTLIAIGATGKPTAMRPDPWH